jgi:choline-sulfatase
MNFIIFNPDEMRAESVGCYGHPLVKTPNIDRLAEEGTRFENCFVQHTVCSPSRCATMTGWYPHVSGHRTLWHLLRPHEPNLYKYLKQAGYYVYWDGGHNDLLAAESFADSVSEWKDSGTAGVCGPIPYEREDPRYYSFLSEPYRGDLEENHDYAKVTAACDFLRSKPDQPFVIHLPLHYPHPCYGAPEPWHSRIDPDDLPPLKPGEQANKPDFHTLIRQYRNLDQVDEAHLRKIQAVYLGMIEFSDHMLGMMLDCLKETGLEDDTCILFFSDHGDYAGDYGLVEKWPSGLEDALTRVPLVIRAPGMKRGHVVEELVELFDIMPTALDLAGVDCRHTHFARSLVPQLQGAAGDPNRAAFAEGGYDTHEPHCFEGKAADGVASNPKGIYYPKGKQQQEHPGSVCRSTMIRTRTHKLVQRPDGQDELYDLAADPAELNNLHGDPAHDSIQRQMEKRLLDWYVHTADVVPFDPDPRGLPPGGQA